MSDLLGDADAYESSTNIRTRTIEASIIYMPAFFDTASSAPDSTVMLLEVDQVEYSVESGAKTLVCLLSALLGLTIFLF